VQILQRTQLQYDTGTTLRLPALPRMRALACERVPKGCRLSAGASIAAHRALARSSGLCHRPDECLEHAALLCVPHNDIEKAQYGV
jgi:hypothetical protein